MAAPARFVSALLVRDAFAVRDLEIPIGGQGQGPRHLLLTGPNGSGKSSILRGLAASLGIVGEPVDGSNAEGVRQPSVEPRPGPVSNAPGFLRVFMPPHRSLSLTVPRGPHRLDPDQLTADNAATHLLQYLVNLRTQQAYAREDGDGVVAQSVADKFDAIGEGIRMLLADPQAELEFERGRFEFFIRLGDGRRIRFTELPDGVAGVVYMWATLMLHTSVLVEAGDAARGIVLIDEPELHLHARLQELVLPFIAGQFPGLQFIVATHSPAVLASLSNATIFDLARREAMDSEELRGIRYGTILTEHFGIDTDFDVATTRQLHELRDLAAANPAPGTVAHEQMRGLLD